MPDDRDSESASHTSRFLSDLTARYDWAESYSPHAALEHNDALSVTELSSVSATRISLEAEYSRIRTDIASLLGATLLLKKRAALMRSITDKYIGGESSLRRLPNEILLEIFEQYVGFNPEPYHVFRTDRGPWKLRQVCRKWHQLASSWPGLWSRFAFYNHDVYRPNISGCFPLHTLDLLRTAILLSAPRSLSVKIVMDKDYEYGTRDTTNEVLGILKSVSEKWESLDAEWYAGPADNPTLTEWLHNLEHGKLPVLKRLAMRIHTYEAAYPSPPKSITAFASAPCLTSVSIVLQQQWDTDNHSPPTDNNFDFISLPYRQLLDFHCVEIYAPASQWPETRFIRRKFFDMLDVAAVPNLRTFSYALEPSNVFVGTGMPERSAVGRIVHCGVVKLGVCHPDILERYAFPALADLSVGDPNSCAGTQYPLETLSLVNSMLVVSGSALTTLRLFGVVLDDYFLSIVRLSKNLEVLEVGIFSWSDLPGQDTVLQSFFQELTMASSSQFDILPVLRCLRIKLSLGNTDGWTPHSGTCVPQIGFANATLPQAVKLRRRHRSLDFVLTLEGGMVDTWEPLATLCDLCESGLVQRKGYAVEYREGGEFLDQLDNEWHSNDDYEPQPKPCVDCARRKEDEEFWRVGGV